MIGGNSKRCEVIDMSSRQFVYIKPVSPIYKFKDFLRTQYFTMGNKIKIFNGKSFEAAVFDVEREQWSEEKHLELEIDPFERMLLC